MTEPQRIWASEIASGYEPGDPDINPEYVLYVDAKRWRDEVEQRVGGIDEAVMLLQTIGLDITYTDDGLRVIARQIVGYGFAAALYRAREAVAARKTHEGSCGCGACFIVTDALAAIDGLKGEQA